MKSIIIQISDPEFSKIIKVNRSDFDTIDTLRKKIAQELFLNEIQFTIDDLNQQKYDSISNNQKFKLKINYNCKDIDFRVSNKTVKIKNGYCKTFNEIIQEFGNKNIYCSILFAKNNFNIEISGNEYFGTDIQKVRYPFLGVPKNSRVIISFIKTYTTIEFDSTKFYFSESDQARIAYDLIFGVFRKNTSYDLISIFNTNTNKKLPGSYILKSSENYRVEMNTIFNFYHFSNHKYNFSYIMNYFINVSDAQKIIFDIFQTESNENSEEFVIRTGKNSDYAADENQQLRNFMDIKGNVWFGIYKEQEESKEQVEKMQKKSKKSFRPTTRNVDSDINENSQKSEESDESKQEEEDEEEEVKSIEINFVVDENERNLRSFKDTISDDIKLDELKLKISRKLKVDSDELSLYYLTKKRISINIDDDSQLINAIDYIVRTFGKVVSESIIHIKLIEKETPKKKSNRRNIKPTIKPQQNNNSSSSSSENEATDNGEEEEKQKRKNQKSAKQKAANKSSPTKKPKTKPRKSSSSDDSEEEEFVKRPPKKKASGEPSKFSYQTNLDETVKEIELEAGATVKQFKTKISELNGNTNLSNIKVLFAGKVLLNDIILDDLDVEDTVLYIYIRPVEDIFLLTAKAIKVENKDDDAAIEEEEEEGDDDVNSNN